MNLTLQRWTRREYSRQYYIAHLTQEHYSCQPGSNSKIQTQNCDTSGQLATDIPPEGWDASIIITTLSTLQALRPSPRWWWCSNHGDDDDDDDDEEEGSTLWPKFVILGNLLTIRTPWGRLGWDGSIIIDDKFQHFATNLNEVTPSPRWWWRWNW